MKILRFILVSLLSASALLGSVAQAQEKVLRVSVLHNGLTVDLRSNFVVLSRYLEKELGMKVQYIPIDSPNAIVDAVVAEKVDLAFLGGLTYVQAASRAKVIPLVQRDEDSRYSSTFLTTVPNAKSIKELSGARFLFGNISATTGSLMPHAYLKKVGIVPETYFKKFDYLKGQENYDVTIERLLAGKYDAAVVSSGFWKSLNKRAPVDPKKIHAIDVTPIFYDFSWVVRGNLGKDVQHKILDAFIKLDASNPRDKEILDLQGASMFIPSYIRNYRPVEAAARDMGMIN